jgi:cell division protein FtsL
VSQPARRLEPAERRTPRRTAAYPSAPATARPTPTRRTQPVAPPARERPAGARRTRPSQRRSIGFVLLASTLVGSMVFGIVVVNVLLAQTSFRIGEAERRLEELSEDNLELVREQATLSAPGRISAWASRHGMRLPDDIRILHAPGSGSGEPAGADPSSGTTYPQGTKGSTGKGDPPT